MSAAFTPGPWTFDGPPSSRIVWADAEHRVCFLTSDGPNLANAHLIAAAPDLYEALEALPSAFEDATNNSCTCASDELGCHYCNAWEAVVRGVNSILAKARGETAPPQANNQ